MTVTSNNTYDIAGNGYRYVNVNVPSSSYSSGSKTFTSNGTYYASSYGYDGFSSVTVNVSSSGGRKLKDIFSSTSSSNVMGWIYTCVDETNSNWNRHHYYVPSFNISSPNYASGSVRSTAENSTETNKFSNVGLTYTGTTYSKALRLVNGVSNSSSGYYLSISGHPQTSSSITPYLKMKFQYYNSSGNELCVDSNDIVHRYAFILKFSNLNTAYFGPSTIFYDAAVITNRYNDRTPIAYITYASGLNQSFSNVDISLSTLPTAFNNIGSSLYSASGYDAGFLTIYNPNTALYNKAGYYLEFRSLGYVSSSSTAAWYMNYSWKNVGDIALIGVNGRMAAQIIFYLGT